MGFSESGVKPDRDVVPVLGHVYGYVIVVAHDLDLDEQFDHPLHFKRGEGATVDAVVAVRGEDDVCVDLADVRWMIGGFVVSGMFLPLLRWEWILVYRIGSEGGYYGGRCSWR